MGDDNEPQIDFTRDVSRRKAMQMGGLSVFGIAAMADAARAEDFDVTPMEEMQEAEVVEEGLEYFTIQQARVVHDMTGRIYPSDENGPGAPEAGVVYFIDKQMNSAWGRGERWYMHGPFAGRNATEPFQGDPEDPEGAGEETEVPWAETTPAETQGWQYPMTPNEAYDQSIHAVEEYVQAQYGAESFANLEPAQQDEVVAALQNEEVGTFDDLDIDASGFFLLIRQNTIEGMFSDPTYGGNREMVGWRLKGFPGTPGALGSYRNVIQQEEFIELEEGDFRKLADDVASLGIGGDNRKAAGDHGEGHPDIDPAEANIDPAEDQHGHVHDAAEADYPKVVDEEAARGDADERSSSSSGSQARQDAGGGTEDPDEGGER